MGFTLTGKLVVAISSRALFDFEEENRVFEATNDSAYMQLQQDRLALPAKAGVAFALVEKLLRFNTTDNARVEVVILSRNDPVSGLRVFRSAEHAGLKLERGVFTRGRPPYHYLRSLRANLFLSANEHDVRETLQAGFPATCHVTRANAERLWKQRKQLFFKPAVGFGSRAAYRGDKLTKRVWDEILQSNYVAQKIVPPSQRGVLVDGKETTLKVDIRAYVYAGNIQLLAARLYQGQTTNFRTQGGGFAPVFVIG